MLFFRSAVQQRKFAKWAANRRMESEQQRTHKGCRNHFCAIGPTVMARRLDPAERDIPQREGDIYNRSLDGEIWGSTFALNWLTKNKLSN